MDIPIRNIELKPGDVVLITGKVAKEEAPAFAGYLKILQGIFSSNPVVFAPDDAPLAITEEFWVPKILWSALSKETLERFRNEVDEAIRLHDNYDERMEELSHDEV